MMRSKLISGITKNLVAEQRRSIPRVEVYQGNSNWKELLKLRVSHQSFSHAPKLRSALQDRRQTTRRARGIPVSNCEYAVSCGSDG